LNCTIPTTAAIPTRYKTLTQANHSKLMLNGLANDGILYELVTIANETNITTLILKTIIEKLVPFINATIFTANVKITFKQHIQHKNNTKYFIASPLHSYKDILIAIINLIIK
jgi:hypothetical protein